MWIPTSDRLPEMHRKVKVWGQHCVEGHPAPKAYRRPEPNSDTRWFWMSNEWRGTVGLAWWWDEPIEPKVDAKTPTT